MKASPDSVAKNDLLQACAGTGIDNTIYNALKLPDDDEVRARLDAILAPYDEEEGWIKLDWAGERCPLSEPLKAVRKYRDRL